MGWRFDTNSPLREYFIALERLMVPDHAPDETMQLLLADLLEDPVRPEFVDTGGLRYYITQTDPVADGTTDLPSYLVVYTLDVLQRLIYRVFLCEASGLLDEDGHIDLDAMREVITRLVKG